MAAPQKCPANRFFPGRRFHAARRNENRTRPDRVACRLAVASGSVRQLLPARAEDWRGWAEPPNSRSTPSERDSTTRARPTAARQELRPTEPGPAPHCPAFPAQSLPGSVSLEIRTRHPATGWPGWESKRRKTALPMARPRANTPAKAEPRSECPPRRRRLESGSQAGVAATWPSRVATPAGAFRHLALRRRFPGGSHRTPLCCPDLAGIPWRRQAGPAAGPSRQSGCRVESCGPWPLPRRRPGRYGLHRPQTAQGRATDSDSVDDSARRYPAIHDMDRRIPSLHSSEVYCPHELACFAAWRGFCCMLDRVHYS